MPTADEMRTLAQEIIDSYDTRIDSVTQIREATQTQLKDLDQAHQDMAHELHAELGQAEAVRKQEEGQRAQDRAQVVTDRKSDVAAQLQDLDNAHQDMAQELHAELGQAEAVRRQEEGQRAQDRAQVVTDRKSDVTAQLQDLDEAHQAMAQELRAGLAEGEEQRMAGARALKQELANGVAELKSEVNTFMNEIAAVHAEARDVWQTLTATMQSKRGGLVTEKPSPAAPQPEIPPLEPSIEPGAEQTEADVVIAEETEEETEAPTDFAALTDLVFEYLANHPDGTKMTELEDEFGVARFQMAKVIKTLMTENKVDKRDTFYFAI